MKQSLSLLLTGIRQHAKHHNFILWQNVIVTTCLPGIAFNFPTAKGSKLAYQLLNVPNCSIYFVSNDITNWQILIIFI